MSQVNLSNTPDSHMLHAYLISPGDDRGLEHAKVMARAAVCSGNGKRPCGTCHGCLKAIKDIHPDIITISKPTDSSGKEKSEIIVAQAREIITDAYILPNESEAKAYIIKDADTMNASAQNALLKLLEEPPSYAYFFLLASNPMALLPTIRSRVARINIIPDEDAEDDTELTEEFFKALETSGLSIAEFCVSIEKLDRDSMRDFLKNVQISAARRIRAGHSGSLLEAAKLFRELENFSAANVSSGHIAGIIAAKL